MDVRPPPLQPGGWGECVSQAQVRLHGHPAHRRRGPLSSLRVVQLEARFCNGTQYPRVLRSLASVLYAVDVADCVAGRAGAHVALRSRLLPLVVSQ